MHRYVQHNSSVGLSLAALLAGTVFSRVRWFQEYGRDRVNPHNNADKEQGNVLDADVAGVGGGA